MNTEFFNESRLKFARKRRGFTIKALSETLGVSTRTYSDIENGHSKPTDQFISKLPFILHFPVKFFGMEDISPIGVESVSFRSMARMTASVRDMALHAGQIALDFSAWIDTKFKLPKQRLPDLRNIDSEGAAAFVRNEWALGEKSIKNMIHLVEAMGVRVFSLDENTLDMDAYSFWIDQQPFIFLNTKKSVEHSRFDCAHELGHLILHKHGAPVGKEVEIEANRFASAFLMPSGNVLAQTGRYMTLKSVVALKHLWLVSAAALVRRLKDLSLLTEWQYRSLMVEMSKNGFLKKEPNPIQQRETSMLLPMVFKALRAEGIYKRDIADELGVHVKDIDAMIFNLALFQIDGGNNPKKSNSIENDVTLRLIK